VVKELKMKAKEQRGQELREMANRASVEMAYDAAAAPPVDADLSEQRIQRDMVREERRRQRECERRQEASSSSGKKNMITRDRDRDVSERIALGMVSTGGSAGAGDLAYDERLFNQDAGMDSGFAADDRYNVYSGRLFAVQPALSMLYGDSDVYGGTDDHIEKRTRTGRFRPYKGFSGASERPVGKRDRLVEFDVPEECGEADDPFVELDQYMAKVKEGKKH
jgi:SNW domain-containing protein 1